jgi:nitrite reductase [NAD(P)H] large subunit
MKEKLVVIGNGMAGMHTVEELLRIAPDDYDITVFGAEPHGNYNRIMLTPVLYGAKQISDIMIHDFAWYQENSITLHCGPEKNVIDIDPEARSVTAEDGTVVAYDRLIIATGSRSYLLPIPGSNVQGVMGFRDIADVETMIDKADTHNHAVILGGGLLGLEAANGLLQRGMQVTVINRAKYVLNKQLDETAGAMLGATLEEKGVQFCLGVSIKKVINDGDHITAVILDDDRELPADILVMATGIEPNIELADAAGLKCEKGIIVDDVMLTSDERIFAVGECVQHRGELFGLVAPVYEQAKVCARSLSGHSDALFKSITPATMLKVSGIDLFSMGNYMGDERSESLVLIDHARRLYRKLVLYDNRVVGVLMYGNTTDSVWYQQLIKNRVDISKFREQLIFGRVEQEQAEAA